MGQAKLRGSFEQRKLEGIERLKLIAEARETKRLARIAELKQWALDNPKQAKVHHRSKSMLLATMAALALMPTTANYTNNEEGLNDRI